MYSYIKPFNITFEELEEIAKYVKENIKIHDKNDKPIVNNSYKQLASYLCFLYEEYNNEYPILFKYHEAGIKFTNEDYISSIFKKINSSIYYKIFHNEIPTYEDIDIALDHKIPNKLNIYLDDIINLVVNSYGYKIENDELIKFNNDNISLLGNLNYEAMTHIILNSIRVNKEIRIKKIKGI